MSRLNQTTQRLLQRHQSLSKEIWKTPECFMPEWGVSWHANTPLRPLGYLSHNPPCNLLQSRIKMHNVQSGEGEEWKNDEKQRNFTKKQTRLLFLLWIEVKQKDGLTGKRRRWNRNVNRGKIHGMTATEASVSNERRRRRWWRVKDVVWWMRKSTSLGPTHSSSTCFMRTDTLHASLVATFLPQGRPSTHTHRR